jgi:hypothetical protein
MRIAHVTANLGNFCNPHTVVSQELSGGMELNYYAFNDRNFPPRDKVMSPRLQAKIPKMFGWQLAPGHDVYVWMDANFVMVGRTAVQWLMRQLGDYDIAVFSHPFRNTVKEEADFLREYIPSDFYLENRYRGEFLDEVVELCYENLLFAAGVFAYKSNIKVHRMMKDWWYYVSRYHINDQLSLPHVLMNSNCSVKVIDGNIYTNGYFELQR